MDVDVAGEVSEDVLIPKKLGGAVYRTNSKNTPLCSLCRSITSCEEKQHLLHYSPLMQARLDRIDDAGSTGVSALLLGVVCDWAQLAYKPEWVLAARRAPTP